MQAADTTVSQRSWTGMSYILRLAPVVTAVGSNLDLLPPPSPPQICRRITLGHTRLTSTSEWCKNQQPVMVDYNVPTALCFHSSMFPQVYVPTALRSHSSMFPQLDILTYVCSHRTIVPQLYYVPTALCSHSSMFPQLCVPTALCSHSSMFPQLYVPTSLCSHRSMFPQLYVPTDQCSHRSMFPQLCVLTHGKGRNSALHALGKKASNKHSTCFDSKPFLHALDFANVYIWLDYLLHIINAVKTPRCTSLD